MQEEMKGKILTVLGPIDKKKAGLTLIHEHILVDATYWCQEPRTALEKKLAQQPISIENLGIVRQNAFLIKDNMVLDDYNLAVKELLLFKRAGGSTIVDVTTSRGMGRDPNTLVALSRETGLNIVARCGYYVYKTHPSNVDTRQVEEIAMEMIKEITEGIDDTGIKAGIIGEIGTSDPIYPDEIKVLQAAPMLGQSLDWIF